MKHPDFPDPPGDSPPPYSNSPTNIKEDLGLAMVPNEAPYPEVAVTPLGSSVVRPARSISRSPASSPSPDAASTRDSTDELDAAELRSLSSHGI